MEGDTLKSLTGDQIDELRAEMRRPDHRSMAEVARDLGTTKGTIAGAFARAGINIGGNVVRDRHGIALHVRVPQPRPKDKAIRESMKGLFGKQMPLSPRDRDEMRRLADEAIAAGRITRLPPGYATGAKTFYREEYSA